MKRAIFNTSILAAAIVAGCQATPARKAFDAHAAYNAALTAGIEARKAGAMSDTAYWRFETARRMAASALASLDARADSNTAPDPKILDLLDRAIREMGTP
jgi:hypothetical protein